jgi:hypothetical protein
VGLCLLAKARYRRPMSTTGRNREHVTSLPVIHSPSTVTRHCDGFHLNGRNSDIQRPLHPVRPRGGALPGCASRIDSDHDLKAALARQSGARPAASAAYHDGGHCSQ